MVHGDSQRSLPSQQGSTISTYEHSSLSRILLGKLKTAQWNRLLPSLQFLCCQCTSCCRACENDRRGNWFKSNSIFFSHCSYIILWYIYIISLFYFCRPHGFNVAFKPNIYSFIVWANQKGLNNVSCCNSVHVALPAGDLNLLIVM